MNGTALKKSFVLYTDAYDVIRNFTPDQKAWLLDAMFLAAVGEQTLTPPDAECRIAFQFIRQQMQRDAVKWDAIKEKRAAAGKKGGTNKALNQSIANVANLANATLAKQNLAKLANVAVTVTDTVNATVTDNVNVIGEVSPRTPLPTVNENQPRETVKQKADQRGTRLGKFLESCDDKYSDLVPKQWADWCRTEYQWQWDAVKSTFDSFHDYWVGVPGQKGTKLDWFATWKNKCRSDADRKRRNGFTGQNPSYLSAGERRARASLADAAIFAAVAADLDREKQGTDS